MVRELQRSNGLNRSVLVASPDFPPARGGIQVLIHRIVSGWSRLKPSVVTFDGPGAAEFDADLHYPVERVRHPPGGRSVAVAALNARTLIRALRTRPDAILCAHIVVAPAVALAARLLRVPYVQYVYAEEVGARPGLARFAVRHATRTIAISGYSRDLTIAAGAPADRITLITPGVDLPLEDAEPVDARPGPPTVVSVARLEERYKGHDVMLRAFPLIRARVPEARWVVVGDGPLRSDLERRAKAFGVDSQVSFLGAVDDEERDRWLRDAHAFCMVSRLPAGRFAGEGFGIVYLEANAHGLPVVAGNVGGSLDAVIDGEGGLLVDPTDHVQVADAHVRLLSDLGYAAQVGESGRRRAQEFDWDLVSRRVEDLLLDLTA